MKHFLFLILLSISLPALSQSSFDELEFEDEELGNSYKISSKNYVLLKSKRGEGGMNKTPEVDALVTAQSKIKEIVLVYTETKEEDYDSREDANRERWENLLLTYPQLFQPGTVYKNICQCSMGGDAETLKKTQGFYLYVNGALFNLNKDVTRKEWLMCCNRDPAVDGSKNAKICATNLFGESCSGLITYNDLYCSS